jgi:hypothetical protein
LAILSSSRENGRNSTVSGNTNPRRYCWKDRQLGFRLRRSGAVSSRPTIAMEYQPALFAPFIRTVISAPWLVCNQRGVTPTTVYATSSK